MVETEKFIFEEGKYKILKRRLREENLGTFFQELLRYEEKVEYGYKFLRLKKNREIWLLKLYNQWPDTSLCNNKSLRTTFFPYFWVLKFKQNTRSKIVGIGANDDKMSGRKNRQTKWVVTPGKYQSLRITDKRKKTGIRITKRLN